MNQIFQTSWIIDKEVEKTNSKNSVFWDKFQSTIFKKLEITHLIVNFWGFFFKWILCLGRKISVHFSKTLLCFMHGVLYMLSYRYIICRGGHLDVIKNAIFLRKFGLSCDLREIRTLIENWDIKIITDIYL